MALTTGIVHAIFSHYYLSVDVIETWWWNLLCCGTFVNIILLVKSQPKTDHEKNQKYLSAIFITSTTVRSLFPRIDVERICFFDSFLSTTIVGRSLATVGEISFSLQISLSVLFFLKEAQARSILPYLIPPLICVAQILCWFGVLTTNQLYHCFEESIWAGCMAMLIPILVRISRRIPDTETQLKLIVCTVITIIYVIYMVMIDVPMYYGRYIENEKLNLEYLSLRDGLEDSMACKLIDNSYRIWKEDSIWMIGYFVFCSYLSVQMINV